MRTPTLLALALVLGPQAVLAADEAMVAGFSARSGLPVMEILPALDNCHRSPHTRNLCAYYEAFVAETALDALVAELGFPPPEAYAALKAESETACVAQAEAALGDGDRHALPAMISDCMRARFQGQRGHVVSEGNLFPLHIRDAQTAADCACGSAMIDDD